VKYLPLSKFSKCDTC